MADDWLKILAAITVIIIASLAGVMAYNLEQNRQAECQEKYDEGALYKFTCVNYTEHRDQVLETVRDEQPVTVDRVAEANNLSLDKPTQSYTSFKTENSYSKNREACR